MSKVNTKCADCFLIRTPSLPIYYIREISEYLNDPVEYIKSNSKLDTYMRKALLVASRSLYDAYVNCDRLNRRKYDKLNESLLKYMLRSACRSTPFGLFSSVSIGKFDEENHIVKGNTKYDISADNAWINKVVMTLERIPEALNHLYVIKNDSCIICGDRVRNICYSSHGCAEIGKNSVDEINIRFTPLYTLIENACKDYICINDLKSLIYEEYDVPEEIVNSTLRQLIENEFLITNLRIPPYCENSLDHIITELNRCNINNDIVQKLKRIKQVLDELKYDFQEKLMLEVFGLMSDVTVTKNYINVNLGNNLREQYLSYEIKEKIELFAETISKISCKHNATERIVQYIVEKYGSNTKIPLLQLLQDGIIFADNGIDFTKDDDSYESLLRVLHMKIQGALIKNEHEVTISREDMSLCNKEGQWQSFEVNMLITDDKEGRNLWIGPNYGSNRSGKMVRRFEDCLSQELLNEYNDSLNAVNNEDIEYVEIREFRSYGEQGNVINNRQYNEKYMVLGYSGSSNDNRVTINDLLISVENNQIIMYSKSLGKQLLFFTDNMLNIDLYNKISQFLIGATEDYVNSPIDRIAHIVNELKYKYTPRINLSGVVISPRRWHFEKNEINAKSFSNFKEELGKLIEQFEIDNLVYLCRFDNRIMVNLNSDYGLKFLFKEYSMYEELQLSEMEKGDPIVYDGDGYLYLNECVFSIINTEPILAKKSKGNSILIQENRCKLPFEDGWVYLKLYGDKKRQNDLITNEIPSLLELLHYEKYYYIRYIDETGDHIRLRIKFAEEDVAIKEQNLVTEWIIHLREKKIINDITISVYEREINRYGGEQSIDIAEDFFYRNSEYIKKLISRNDLTNHIVQEEVAIVSLICILNNMVKRENQLVLLNSMNLGDSHRSYYRKHRKNLSTLLQKANVLRNSTESELVEQNRVLKRFRINLIKTAESLTNDYDNIVLSLMHMNCNRIGLDTYTERKYMELLRNIVYDYSRKEQNTNRKGH